MGAKDSARRIVRAAGSRGWLVARRLGLIPSGSSDRLGEDAALLGRTLTQRVMVFFPDPPGSLYQIEQWYPTFRAVDAELGLVVVLQDSRTARRVRAESGVETIVVAESTTIDDLLSRSPVELVLYVNHNPGNFVNMRLRDVVHVSLMHGDSDKSVSVSNQLKAYDYAFVAGQAAVERTAEAMYDYDAAVRCIPVGRPQVDELLAAVAARPRGDHGRTTVLYAPSWEGPQASSAYGSVASHGEALVRGLLADPRFRVVYRPHPLTGVNVPSYAAADATLRGLIAAVGAPHRVDVGVPLAESFADADLLVCDVSGVAVDWLALDRPLVITRPAGEGVWEGRSPLRERVPALAAEDAGSFAGRVEEILGDAELATARRGLTEHYLGDVTPGAAEQRFAAACAELIARRGSERAARAGGRDDGEKHGSNGRLGRLREEGA